MLKGIHPTHNNDVYESPYQVTTQSLNRYPVIPRPQYYSQLSPSIPSSITPLVNMPTEPPLFTPPSEPSPASKYNKIEHLLVKKDKDPCPSTKQVSKPAECAPTIKAKENEKFRSITRSQTRTISPKAVIPYSSSCSPQKRKRTEIDDAITKKAKEMRISFDEEHSSEHYVMGTVIQSHETEQMHESAAESAESLSVPVKEIEIFLDDESLEEPVEELAPAMTNKGIVKELTIEIPEDDEEF